MKRWPRCSLQSVFGDQIVYRNLEPLDRRIPGLRKIWPQIGLSFYRIPRKAKDEAYVRVLLHFLDHMQALRGGAPLERLLYLGNRQARDQATLRHFAASTSLPLVSFLCEEDQEQERSVVLREGHMLANRWRAILDLTAALYKGGFPLDGRTAAIVDMDKTIIAARGRNSDPLNRSRVEGVKLMVQEVLGERFAEARFQAVYGEINQPKYHFFTEDNQDYVTYISLMASALVYPIHDLVEDLAFGKLTHFAQFLEITGERLSRQPGSGLRRVYKEVLEHFLQGDPTVFKSFRTKQYESILARIDRLPDNVDEKTLLAEEIVITQEVLDFVCYLQARGVLSLLISDRPDESLIPSAELAQQGYLPIHCLPMKVVGQPLAERLLRLYPL